MITALIRALAARRRLRAHSRRRCSQCGLRADQVDPRVCEGPWLTTIATPDRRDPHSWGAWQPTRFGGYTSQPGTPTWLPRVDGEPAPGARRLR